MKKGKCLLKTFEIAEGLRVNPENKQFNLFDLYACIPVLIAELEETLNDGQKELITELMLQYGITAYWLRFYFKEIPDLYQKLIKFIRYKPYSDFAIARYNFCYECWMRLPEAQNIAINHAELWLLCEINHCLICLRDAGFWGIPKVGSDGKTLGKTESIKENQHIYSEAVKAIKNDGDFSQIQLDSYNPHEPVDCLTCYLWALAMNQAIDHKDDALMEFCNKWKSSELHHTGIAKNSHLMQIVYIRDRALDFTSKGKKSWKPKTKKGRGRPPKGSK